MGPEVNLELLRWLEAGHRLITASERTARALTAEYNQQRRDRGEAAWEAPRIETWTHFVASCWQQMATDDRMVLTPLQEQALWSAVVGAEAELATSLEPSRQRLGRMAMEAHTLLANYAPRALDPRTRSGWQRDEATFSRWLIAFEAACSEQSLLSPARLPLELLPRLAAASTEQREAILLAGFDRLVPAQRDLLAAWGEWKELPLGEACAEFHFYATAEQSAEMAACARWAAAELERNPQARLLVIVQGQSQLKGQLERAFDQELGSRAAALVEFSMGLPLARTALVRSGRQLLTWLTTPLEEYELDHLLGSGYATAHETEQSVLLRRMRRLREQGRQRTHWSLDGFLNEPCDTPPPAAWVERLQIARHLLQEQLHSALTPLQWAEWVPQLLQQIGWLSGRKLESAEYQLHKSFTEALDHAASLGVIQKRCSWNGFLSSLDAILAETLHASESRNAPILVAGPAETAGLSADAIWFLGATEDAWPAVGSTHPFLPLELQRATRMPHAHPRIDWELAEVMTHRLAASAAAITFSHAHQNGGAEANPSRLVLRFAGAPTDLPTLLRAEDVAAPRVERVDDATLLPSPAGSAPGGSALIADQSCCAFRAFAQARLGASGWNAAEPGLTAAQRGTLLHAVLHAIWSGKPNGIRSHAELVKLHDLEGFVRAQVQTVMASKLPSAAREQMPASYLALEAERLSRLIAEWLAFEQSRTEFTVAATELQSTASVAGLTLNLRLDRIDELSDGTELIVDYKTGDVKTKAWDLPRPEDPQLPLYATFGRTSESRLGGLVFAKVRKGQQEMVGRVATAATLSPAIKGTHALARRPLTAEMLMDWRDEIERLAADFVAGRAEVNPRHYPESCAYCQLSTLCRVRSFPPGVEEEEESEEAAHA